MIFTWDSSASVSRYISIIYNAVSRFADSVTPGEEMINLLPFGKNMLLASWEDRPHALQTTLQNYARTSNSSASQVAL